MQAFIVWFVLAADLLLTAIVHDVGAALAWW